MIELAFKALPTVAFVLIVATVLSVLDRILRRRLTSSDKGFQHQIIMLVAGAAGLFGVLLVIPITDTLRGQLLSLVGLVASAAIALSSTTFLGNALAGIMLRVLQNFHMGDFIRVGDHFGRVSGRGLFHTEIQTETRGLVTLPNLYLVTNPVTTIRESGTVVSAEISLGYDIPRSQIEKLLLQAAEDADLEDPFVHIMQLGDFSVTYRVAGIQKDVKVLLTAQSRLKGCVLDRLHRGGVEIVSPTFMNTRAFEPKSKFIPAITHLAPEMPPQDSPEAKLFDKAEEAESMEEMREVLEKIEEQIKELKDQKKLAGEQTEKDTIESRISQLDHEKDRLKTAIGTNESRSKEE